MTQLNQFLTPADLKAVSHLQVLARQVVEGFISGLHRSPHKGFSVEFAQHRGYAPGDDIRRMDWNVFGKTDRFYIKEYEEETNLRCTILLDASGSMAYGRASHTKLHYATRVAAVLSYLMLGQQDAVGLVTFDDKLRKYIPARARANHLHVLLGEMARTEPGGETDIGDVLHTLVPRIPRRGLLMVISDCFGDVPSLLAALAHLRHAHHEVVVFQIWDRDELDFPFSQWTRFDCFETAGKQHLVDPVHLRAAYLAALETYRADLTRGCRRHRIDLVPLVTDEPYAQALARYLTLRQKYG